jgi:hypothetical protein
VRSVALALVLAAPLARADALPPQRTCPPGTILSMSHSGGSCVLAKPECPEGQVALPSGPGFGCAPKAPTNCPDGWRGDTSLADGARCVVADCTDAPCPSGTSCVDQKVCVEERDTYGYGTSGRQLLGAPPVVRRVKFTVGICGAQGCAAPAECVAGRVCLASGKTPALVAPPPIPPPPPAAPKSSGCAGCAVSERPEAPALALLVFVSAAWAARRRR